MAHRQTRNPRRVALERLRALSKAINYARTPWDIAGYVYVPPAERVKGAPNCWRRKRRPDEYPENSPQSWEGLAAWCRAIQDGAAELEAFARQQSKATAERRAEGAE